ncbi:MAG: hypothetical protein ACQEWI_07290 [Bacillota bacterium]
MTITKHVIDRFQERITSEIQEVVRFFIQEEIQKSTQLYRLNKKEGMQWSDLPCSIALMKQIQSS